MTKTTHGGKREGAGRPKVGETRVAIRLTEEQIAWLDEICENQAMNRSEFIRGLIEKLMQNRK
jgi:metal-responsive CopG/Arc/MetJ family transcriptional regulator